MAVMTTNKPCLRKAKNQFEKHQMGFDGEHIGEVVLRRLGYKGVKLTSHKSKFDILTAREAWEIKTVGRDAVDKKMSVKARQKLEKLAWAKKNRKSPKSMMVVVNDSAEVYIRDGLGKFRPGGMKKVRTFKNWRKEVGHGRTERLVEGKPLVSFKKAEVSKFISERNKLPKKFTPFVTPYSEAEYAEMGAKVYLSETGRSGYALTRDGDLISVFSHEKVGEGSMAIMNAIKNGARSLDCYDGKLVDIYRRFGFYEYKRMPWNERFQPPGWSHEKFDDPDVIFMKLEGTKAQRKKGRVTEKFRKLQEEFIAYVFPELKGEG